MITFRQHWITHWLHTTKQITNKIIYNTCIDSDSQARQLTTENWFNSMTSWTVTQPSSKCI